ncbi:hypothetical protein J7E38_15335 [Bacillus sp. ISL-35]|uniref:hypothetical protein n=1 Tax=Bacillus sp. ISL-35 TaxID=2819122 RepID=UPI001BE9B441|nr:hypothetical protein [Bacillus sp. ISL-35]MBT2680383.1 hypothetical protein [Bacillus sp. ISL-35]MBT2704325.1 hypothetical protein [Chryseobacterium sp. ISL-80]
MSEAGLTSDKINVKSRRNVRTWSDFGQNEREEPLKCPNAGQLQTKPAARAVEMSERGSTSDKIIGKSGRNV